METLIKLLQLDHLKPMVASLNSAGRVAVILVIAWFAAAASRKLIRAFRKYMEARTPDTENFKRINTLARVFRYLATAVITLVAGTLALSELGIAIAPILGAAGVVGIAVGFGAQSLIKDYFNGFFLLLEDQIRQGDVIRVAEKAGLVEEITLRHIRLRSYEGDVHYVPNGLITTVTNMSRGHSMAVVDVGVGYGENVDEVMTLMRQVSASMRDDPDFAPRILDEIEIAGVDAWADSAVKLRARIKVRPLEQWAVRREYLRRLKVAFDEHGVEIPFPQVTINRVASKAAGGRSSAGPSKDDGDEEA